MVNYKHGLDWKPQIERWDSPSPTILYIQTIKNTQHVIGLSILAGMALSWFLNICNLVI